MTPKEKAEELIKKFDLALINTSIYFEIRKYFVYNCALITVDSILNEINWVENKTPIKEIKFWIKVKQEIKKLKNAK
jgi:hypothetical protein